MERRSTIFVGKGWSTYGYYCRWSTLLVGCGSYLTASYEATLPAPLIGHPPASLRDAPSFPRDITVAAMSKRSLYIAAYDISDDARLRKALFVLRNYSTGGQKSVFECFLTMAEKRQLIDEIKDVIDEGADRFLLLRLDPRMKVRVLGIAVPPADPEFFYVG
jgi:CRISPR-associated protein Cas2